MDWTTGRSRFDPRQRRKDFPSNLSVQTGSVAHPASCTMSIKVILAWVKRGQSMTLTTHPHLMPRSRIGRNCTHLPLCACLAQRDSFTVTLLTVFPDDLVAGEDILCLLWNTNVYFSVHDSKPLVSTLSHMKQYVAYPHLTFIYINIISNNVFPGLQNGISP
jgi:hypothetical protein